jgi:hypothetical protein
VLATLANGAGSSDIYIFGTVLGRAQGSGSSLVRISWDYKCLGEDLGTYDWTLKVIRTEPLPERTTTLGSGTSKRGEKTVKLTPGTYLPTANPYNCETTRGQGYDRPEIGALFTVPEYCAWKVLAARGAVELEQGTAVKRARPGATVAPGDSLVTPRGAKATISSLARDGKASLAGASRLSVDPRRCAAKGGWRLLLAAGTVTASVSKSAAPRASYQTATNRVTVSGSRGSGWRLGLAGKKATIRVIAGKVLVAKKAGRPVTLGAGKSLVVKG